MTQQDGKFQDTMKYPNDKLRKVQAIDIFKTANYLRNRQWRPIGLCDTADPTLSRQSVLRWR
jgi:hypothetical protein